MLTCSVFFLMNKYRCCFNHPACSAAEDTLFKICFGPYPWPGVYSQRNVQPNPPLWPHSVRVFGPTDKGIGDAIASAYAVNGGHDPANHGQFSKQRFAFLFKPGEYDVDCPVGYYTQVLGLGKTPSDVTFSSPKGVYSQEQDFSSGGALSTFWRSAENFKTTANYKWYVGVGMLWAVSQAAPLRRIEVENELYFMNMSHLFHRLDIRVVLFCKLIGSKHRQCRFSTAVVCARLYNWWMARRQLEYGFCGYKWDKHTPESLRQPR